MKHIQEEVGDMIIGGQHLRLVISAVEQEKSLCCTKFHWVYFKRELCCGCMFGEGLNLYIDSHLEWASGTNEVKKMLLEGAASSRRISQFDVAGTPFSAR